MVDNAHTANVRGADSTSRSICRLYLTALLFLGVTECSLHRKGNKNKDVNRPGIILRQDKRERNREKDKMCGNEKKNRKIWNKFENKKRKSEKYSEGVGTRINTKDLERRSARKKIKKKQEIENKN